MDSDSLTSYSGASPFVEKYAIEDDGLGYKLDVSGIVSSAERVVVLDALMRKHYTVVSVGELNDVTGLAEPVIERVLESFMCYSVVSESDGDYRIDTESSRVQAWRDEQNRLF
jgi:hypothetical protein